MTQQLVRVEASSKTFFTPELILQQLDLILQTDLMRSSGMLLRFHEFVVEETLHEIPFILP
jgi:hypothetical protein